MSEPLRFVKENIAHYLFIGIEHIYIGTQELCFIVYLYINCVLFPGFCLFLENHLKMC